VTQSHVEAVAQTHVDAVAQTLVEAVLAPQRASNRKFRLAGISQKTEDMRIGFWP
jgi:hypothetical protein